MTEIEIAGRIYSAKTCGRCAGTGVKHDPTDADKVNAGPYTGRCTCRDGQILTLRPAADVAHAMAAEENMLRTTRERQEIGEMPDWMCASA